jgi:hypothetical protein
MPVLFVNTLFISISDRSNLYRELKKSEVKFPYRSSQSTQQKMIFLNKRFCLLFVYDVLHKNAQGCAFSIRSIETSPVFTNYLLSFLSTMASLSLFSILNILRHTPDISVIYTYFYHFVRISRLFSCVSAKATHRDADSSRFQGQFVCFSTMEQIFFSLFGCAL